MIMYIFLKIISFIHKKKNNKYIGEKFLRRILGWELSDKFCFQFFFIMCLNVSSKMLCVLLFYYYRINMDHHTINYKCIGVRTAILNYEK